MPRDTRSLLIKAVPRLQKEDAKAKKLEAKLAKLGASLWNKGPRGLRKIGVKLDEDDHRELERDELFDGAREILGDREFVRFVRKVKDVLAKKLERSKEGGDSEKPSSRKTRSSGKESREKSDRRSRSDGKRRRPKPAPEPEPESAEELVPDDEGMIEINPDSAEGGGLTMSGSGLAVPEDSGMGLALPDDDSGMGLALPDDMPDLDVPDLEVPAEDAGGSEPMEFDLDNLELEVKTGGGDAGSKAAPAASMDDDDDDPARGADRALARYERTGDASALKEAKKLFKAASKVAEGPVATGAVRGGLARCCFLEGDLDKAKDLARKALKVFPHEPTANAVICQVSWPNEVEREKARALLARADSAFSTSDYDEVKEAAKALAKELPKEPFAALLLLAIECDKLQDDLSGPLGKAWKSYPPSPAYADLVLGLRVERLLIEGCLRWLDKQVNADPEVLGNTVKDVESKDNLHAGAFQIALGLSRAAACGHRKLEKRTQQQLATWTANAVFFAQYYDHAKELCGKAMRFDREGDLVGEIRRIETQCGVMKRAFDRPGVKFKSGKLDGVGVARYREAVAARLKQVLGDLEGDREKLDAKEAKIVDAILADPARKKALQKAAKKAGDGDPFAVYEALEAEINAVGAKDDDAPKKKGGLLGRMKAAAQGAIDKAKAAAQTAVLANKKKEARRALGDRLREAPDKGWGDADLDAFLAKSSLIEPRLDYLESVAEDLRAAAGRAGA